MRKENKDLLEELIRDRLNDALLEKDNKESKAFEEAMKAIDRQLEIDKKELEMQKEQNKLNHEKEQEESRQQFELMKEESKQQFESEIQDRREEHELEKERLKSSLESERDEDNRNFQWRMEESRQQFELGKEELVDCREREKAELEAKRQRREMFMKGVEIAAVVVIAPLIDAKCKTKFAQMLCEFEEDHCFSTMAGKSLSGLFKFKK